MQGRFGMQASYFEGKLVDVNFLRVSQSVYRFLRSSSLFLIVLGGGEAMTRQK